MKPSNTLHTSEAVSSGFISDTSFGGMQPLNSLLDFIAARHVRETDCEIPLSTHAIVQAATVAVCNGIRDAPFRRYSVNGERSSGTASTPSKAGSDGSGRYNGFSDATNGIRAVSAMNPCLRHEVTASANSPASVKMSPPLPKPKTYQSCFCHVHTERGGCVHCGTAHDTTARFRSSVQAHVPTVRESPRGIFASWRLYWSLPCGVCQLMTNLMPSPHWQWNFFVSPPHRQRSRRLASRAIRSAT